MEKLTENMIRFAESKLGSTEYAGWCLAFKRGIMPADKVSFYNRIDTGIFICFMDLCLWHNGVRFEKILYSDAGDDKELVLNAKYRLCR